MNFKYDFSDLENLENNLNKLSDELSSNNDIVPFDKLFNSKFMVKYTSFDSFESFFDAGNFDITSQESFDSIPESELDDFVVTCSNFSSFQEMLDTAGQEYIQSSLNL